MNKQPLVEELSLTALESRIEFGCCGGGGGDGGGGGPFNPCEIDASCDDNPEN
ncbi:MAG: hypothetical protein R3F22_00945 [Lysobacteraceae bacterium]